MSGSSKVTKKNEALEKNRIPVFIGVTGHRKVRMNGDDEQRLKNSIKCALNEIRQKCKYTDFILLTSLAAGADQIAATVARDMNMKFAVVLPMSPQEYFYHETDGQPDFNDDQRRTAKELIEDKLCVFVYTMPRQEKQKTDGNISQADLQFRETARFISDNSFAGIAMWNGRLDAKNAAGTGPSVRDSLHGKTYHSNCFSGITIPETRPIYHIYTPCEGDAPAEYDYEIRRLFPEPLLETGVRWFTLEDAIEKGEAAVLSKFKEGWHSAEDERKKRIRKQLKAINRYNRNVVRYAKQIADHKDSLKVNEPGERAEFCEKHYKAADKLAIIYQNKRRNGSSAIIWLAGIAYILLNVFSDLIKNPVFLALYFALLLIAVVVWFVVDKKKLHSHFVNYRALAEGLRVQYYWYAADIRDNDDKIAKDNGDNIAQAQNYYLRRQKGHMEWIRYAIRVVNLLAMTKDEVRTVSADDAKAVSDIWIGKMDVYDQENKRWVYPTEKLKANGQSGYFLATSIKRPKDVVLPAGAEQPVKKAEKYVKYTWIKWLNIGLIATSLGIALALAVCLFVIPENPLVVKHSDQAMFISGLLPVIAMIFSEISRVMGYEEDINRYTWYYNVFKRAMIEVDETYNERYYTFDDENEKADAIKSKLFEIGKEALVENADWVMINEKRAPEVPSN